MANVILKSRCQILDLSHTLIYISTQPQKEKAAVWRGRDTYTLKIQCPPPSPPSPHSLKTATRWEMVTLETVVRATAWRHHRSKRGWPGGVTEVKRRAHACALLSNTLRLCDNMSHIVHPDVKWPPKRLWDVILVF